MASGRVAARASRKRGTNVLGQAGGAAASLAQGGTFGEGGRFGSGCFKSASERGTRRRSATPESTEEGVVVTLRHAPFRRHRGRPTQLQAR